MSNGFPGRGHKSGYPDLCEECGAVATHRGTGMKDNFPRRYRYCSVCGPQALKSFVITRLEEYGEFTTWKKKEIAASKQRHPSSQMAFLDES